LPEHILLAARAADAIREGPVAAPGSGIRTPGRVPDGIEIRGPTWRSFSAGGDKTLVRL
jgi:hypothetical protein